MLIQSIADPEMAADTKRALRVGAIYVVSRCRADVIGHLHAIGGVGHQITEFGPTPKQMLVLENHMGETVTITLWNELATILERVALIQADLIEPVVSGVSCFGGARDPVAELPVQFATAEANAADAANSARTIADLLDLHTLGGSVDAKYHCSGFVKSVESRNPCYKMQLTLRDSTGEAPFIVFGSCGKRT
ncbi:unnamed protein product [Linum tenue]|uniref:Uncharacterized protein n=1 Tax=Linum tenue TaxID=586396 RepID=A0AAV0J1B8_9ROSI|nr:unnamed protein product [Linum tenue]